MLAAYMQKANIAMPKQIIMYIASTAQASVFKNRCIELANEVEIATLKDFGEEPANDSFLKMNKLMLNGTINWTIFDWETVSKLVGGNVFVQELKELIRTGAIRRSKTYIVDRNDSLGNKDIFANFGIGIVEDETLIGNPFNKMLSLEQMEIKKVENENELFGGMSAPSYANDPNRLPGTQDTTPSQVSKRQSDPFEEMAATAHPASPEEDPFTVYESAPTPAPAPAPSSVPAPIPQSAPTVPADPFAAFTVGGAMSTAQSAPMPAEDDIFAELDGDLGGSVEDDLGNISGDDLYNDNLFDMLEEQADATIAAAETDDPFAAFSYMDDNTVLGGESAFDAGDPFADMEASMAQGLNPNGTVAVDDVIGGIGGVMSGSSVAEDVVGNVAAPASATSGTDDPFAAFDTPEQEPLSSAENVQQASDDDISAIFGDMETNDNDDASFDPFAEMDRGNNIASTSSRLPAADNVFEDEPDEDDEFDDPFGEMSDEDLAMAQAVARGEMPIDEPPAHTPSPASNGQKFSSVEELLEMYGDGLGDNDFNKMMSMIEPMWDYSLEEADGIGGGGGLFKKGGTKGVGSQSEENELADSLYIDEMERINGYYSPPDDAKIITVNSQKGGTGKQLPNSTPILVQKPGEGVCEMTVGDVRPGDKIFNRKGKLVEVKEIHPSPAPDEIYEVELRDGRRLQCSADHLWTVLARGTNRAKVISTLDMMNSEEELLLPLADAVEMPEQHLDVPPYNIGAKISCEKLIPSPYLYGSIVQREELHCGLMSSNIYNTEEDTFTVDNKYLASQLSWLIRSLGRICICEEHNEQWTISAIDADDTIQPSLLEENAPVAYTNQKESGLPIDPYLLGAVLAFGRCSSASVSVFAAEQETLLELVSALGKTCLTRLVPSQADMQGQPILPCSLLIENPHLSHALDEIGAVSYKDSYNIPEQYLHGTIGARHALLQGMMDTYGHIDDNTALPFLSYNSNKQKAQLTELIEGLGYHIREVRDSNKLLIETCDENIFRSSLQKEQMHLAGNLDGSYISITSIKKTGRYEDMTCFYLDDPEHLYLAGDFVVTHNTSISVGIATQLNWYFNPKLMQRMTTNYNSRVLIFSTNEFDDIPVHGIGYEEAISEENDTDGKNVAELLRRIEDTNGQPMWDDIMHCFVSTEQNRVFYLPSLTQREILEDNINITAEDYKRVVECCSRFFQFIIIDTPDIFYQEKNDLMNFVYNVADIICMIIEPDLRSTANLYHFFDGLKTDTGKVPLNPDKCLLVVNKYVASGNPYMPVAPIGQIPYESICKNMSSYFARFCCLPFTRPRGYGNIIYGTDPKIKLAFGELVDIILEMIDYNDAQAAKKKLGKK